MYSPITLRELVSALQPASPQTPSNFVFIDNLPTIPANLIQIDFFKESFDRKPCPNPQESLNWGDPPPGLAFELANNLILRLRAVSRGCELRLLDPAASFWRLDYLTDQGEIVPRQPQIVRRRGGRPFHWRVAALTNTIWQRVQELPPDFCPQIWDTLALDAEQLLPDINAAVALANASLEAFSKWLLDQLAESDDLPSGLWQWINKRDFFLKEPSVDDRFDPLLKIFTNHSLKEQVQLWNAYKDLRKARNSFSHAGKPMIGDTEVTVLIASTLVKQAQEIIDWCEQLLPEASRRPKITHVLNFSFPINLEGLPTLNDEEPAGS